MTGLGLPLFSVTTLVATVQLYLQYMNNCVNLSFALVFQLLNTTYSTSSFSSKLLSTLRTSLVLKIQLIHTNKNIFSAQVYHLQIQNLTMLSRLRVSQIEHKYDSSQQTLVVVALVSWITYLYCQIHIQMPSINRPIVSFQQIALSILFNQPNRFDDRHPVSKLFQSLSTRLSHLHRYMFREGELYSTAQYARVQFYYFGCKKSLNLKYLQVGAEGENET